MPLLEIFAITNLVALGWSWLSLETISRMFGKNNGRLSVRIIQDPATREVSVEAVPEEPAQPAEPVEPEPEHLIDA
jgi:hypothetical protein